MQPIGGWVIETNGSRKWKWSMSLDQFELLQERDENVIVSDYFKVTGSHYTTDEIRRLSTLESWPSHE